MVAAFDFCLHGKGGAAPSIDTPMHALVGPAHVDHLHPDAGIALATSVDGEALTRACFGHRVRWVPWRRPVSSLASTLPIWPTATGGDRGDPGWSRHYGLGSHQRRVRVALARDYPHCPGLHRRQRPAQSVWPRVGSFGPPDTRRRARAAALFPFLRGLASTDARQVGHFTDSDTVLDFLASERHHQLAMKGTSCRTTSCGRRCARSCSTSGRRPAR